MMISVRLLAGLIMLLGMCEQSLKQLHVPDTISLNQAVLRHLPCGLGVALLAVAFDDACVDHQDGKIYAFPSYMPVLKHLCLQVSPCSPFACSCTICALECSHIKRTPVAAHF